MKIKYLVRGFLFLMILCVFSCTKEEEHFIPKPDDNLPDTIPVWTFDKYPGKEWTISSPLKYGYNPSYSQVISKFITQYTNTTGLVVVVGGEIIYTYGNLTELSYLASCRKSLLAMLYGKYVVNGTIDLEKTIDDLGFDDVGGLLPIEKTARVYHLITARSGVYHLGSNLGDDRAYAPERGTKIPGEYYLYNNWDFNCAGAAFETMTGLNIYDAFQADIAIPIQMQDFSRSAQQKSGDLTISVFPAYHFWLSTRDMARIGYLMLRGGKWNDTQVIPAEWATQIVSIVTPLQEMNPVSRRSGYFGYGIMWWIWDGYANKDAFKGAYTAMGAYGQFITVLPALDMVVAHKTSSGDTPWDPYYQLILLITDAQITKNYLNK